MAPVRVALIVVAALVAPVVWIGGSIAFAQYTEDLCFEDGDVYGYGGYTQNLQSWPPSFQCVLRDQSDQPDLTIDHRLLGTAISSWRYGFPLAAAIGLAIAAVSSLNRSAGRTSGGS